MDSKERVGLAFAHQEPDRVPLFEIHVDSKPASEILGHWTPAGGGGAVLGKLQNEMIIAGKVDEFYAMHMEARLEVLRKLGQDILRAFPYHADPPVPEPIGENTWRVPAVLDSLYMAVNVWRGDGKGRDYWTIFRFVPETDGYIEVDSSVLHYGIPQLEQMVGELEQRGPDISGLSFRNMEWALENASDVCKMGWADVPYFANSWMALFLESMAARPDLIDRWFAVQQAYILQFLEAQLQLGADLILGGQDMCDTSGPMFSPRHYKRWFQPFLLAITEMCHRYGVPYLRHNDGRLGPIEELFLLESGLDGWHAIEPKAGNDIFHFKEKYGDKITLAGNVDCAVTLVTGTPEEVYEETRDKILGCAPGGGYILSSSNSIHSGVPARNYLAMVEAWRDYGSYPIRGE